MVPLVAGIDRDELDRDEHTFFDLEERHIGVLKSSAIGRPEEFLWLPVGSTQNMER